jgi:predicted dehydrogenase
MLLDWGVHIIDQLLWLYPEKIKRVAADFSTVLGEKVDDGFTATFWFEDGLKTTVEVGTTNLISLARWYVLGTQGTAMITNFGSEGEMAISTGARNTNPVPVQAGVGLTKTMAPLSEEQMLVRELPEPEKMSQSFYRNLYAVLRNDATPVVKNSEVLRVLKLIATVSEAAATHQILPFE